MKNIMIVSSFAIFLVACSSSPKVAYKDSSLKKGVTKYAVRLTDFDLALGHGALPGDTAFANRDMLALEFKDALAKNFSEKNIYVEDEGVADAVAEIKIYYTRRFNFGGKSLNKPEFNYSVEIKKNNALVASYGASTQATRYGPLEDVAVNVEIGAFKWGADDELRDVNLISNTIASEVYRLGK